MFSAGKYVTKKGLTPLIIIYWDIPPFECINSFNITSYAGFFESYFLSELFSLLKFFAVLEINVQIGGFLNNV